MTTEGGARTGWTFLTNHAHVLLVVAREPRVRVRDIAEAVGITERAAHRILGDLLEAGYLERERVGRRNSYHVHPDLPLRHPLESDHSVRELLTVLTPLGRPAQRPQDRSPASPSAG